MSKQLAKLLSICALVVLLPFIVIGTALTFTEAIGVTISIAQAGLNGAYVDAGQVGLYVDGQKQADTIEVKKNKTVELSFQGEGYYFYGWYEGDAGLIQKGSDEGRISKEEKINYVVTANKTVTAVRDVQKYNISYEGTKFDGTALDTTSQEGVEYGAHLPELEGNTQLFRGWKIKGSTSEPLFVAQFEADEPVEEITLEPVWKTDFSIPVAFNINDDSAENTVSLNYNAVSGITQYTKTRENFVFAGLKIEGVDKLFSDYVTVQGFADYQTAAGERLYETLKENPTSNVYAVWESVYAPFKFNYEATSRYEGPITGEVSYWAIFKDANNDGKLTNDEAYINDAVKEYVFSDETDLTIEENMLDYVLGDTTNLVTRNGEKVQFANKVVINVYQQVGYRVDILLDDQYPCTFKNIMDDLLLGLKAQGLNLSADQLNTYSFSVDFIFEVV